MNKPAIELREHILNEIKRLAAETGQAPGHAMFKQKTQIGLHEWRGKYWARWGDALNEAGFGPNKFNQRIDPNYVLLKVAEACRQYGKIPTRAEFELHRRNDPLFPSYKGITAQFGGLSGLIDALAKHLKNDENFSDIVGMLPDRPVIEVQIVQQKSSNISNKLDGYVYLLKSGDFYKIGRSDDIERRVKEIRIALPDKVAMIHTIRTDDPPGIESYWHNRFKERRANGEWFKLSSLDISAFKKRKYQ